MAHDDNSVEPGAAVYPENSRAVLSLVLGVMGIAGFFILGPFAWFLGSREVRGIDEGRRHPGNRRLAGVARILGIVGSGLFIALTVGIAIASLWVAGREGVVHAESMLDRVLAANREGEFDDGLALVDELIATYGSWRDPEIEVQVATAMTGRGFLLENLGRYEEARAAYEEMVDRYEESTDASVANQVAVSMAGVGRSLDLMRRYEEALDAYDAVVDRYSTNSDPLVLGEVAYAMVGRGVALENLGRANEALVAYDEALERFGESSDPSVEVSTAVAMTGRGVVLSLLDRNAEAMAAWDEVISDYGTTSDLEPRSAWQIDYQVATAYLWKLSALVNSGDTEAAGSTWAAMVVRFASNEDPAIDDLLSEATSIMKDVQDDQSGG